jgi:hypothetical protein
MLDPSSNSERIIIKTAFHHMIEGMYDGWTHHVITVRPSFNGGIRVTVGGKDRAGIKQYLGDLFWEALQEKA